jgi:hypothetical protein
MQFPNIRIVMAVAFLVFCGNSLAQEKVEREVDIHKNTKLIEMAPPSDLAEDIVTQYRSFLPILEAALKESTTDQSDECSLTIRVSAGMKEIGAAKIKRPIARISAFRRNSRQEYMGNLILYSYLTAGPINKEETMEYLKKQILDPAECIKTD